MLDSSCPVEDDQFHHTGSISFLFQVSFLLSLFSLLVDHSETVCSPAQVFHRLHLSVNSFMDSCSFSQHSQGCFTWFLEKFSTKFWISAFFDDLITDGFIHAWKLTGYSLLAQTAHKLIDSFPFHLLHLAENMSLKWNINFRCKIVIQDCNAIVKWSILIFRHPSVINFL